MKCVCLEGLEKVSMSERPEPARKPGEALLAVKAASICGSDVKAYKGHGTPVNYPLVLGHEAVADILEIDANNAAGLKAGDRVVIDPYIYCGKCYACSLGRFNCCETLKVLGVHTDGCMSAYFAHPDHLLHRAPDDVPVELTALAEPLTIALHALHRTSLKAGEHIAIFGAGAIGLLAAMAALHYDAVPIVIDVVETRLKLARTLGVEFAFNSRDGVAAAVRDATNGRMAEVVMEATGVEACIHDTVGLASYCGRIALTGWPTKEPVFDTFSVTKKELQIYGARNSHNEFGEALRLIERKKVDVSAILTETTRFDDLANALERLAKDPSRYLKIVGKF
jgi:2-desacetyl-2-hydroxyethyl bacteriochlorophyllide A dehydrogenase